MLNPAMLTARTPVSGSFEDRVRELARDPDWQQASDGVTQEGSPTGEWQYRYKGVARAIGKSVAHVGEA